MTLSLALAAAALLAAEPSSLPPGHPPLGAGSPPAAEHPAHPSAPPGEVPEGHPPMTGRVPSSAEELLQQLDAMQGLKQREKTFEIAQALGKLYYTQGRSSESVVYFLQAEQKAQATRELYLAQRKKLGKRPVPSAQAADCGFTPKMSLEAMSEVAAERAKKGDAASAAACARAALEPVLEVESLRANALFLAGDMEGALVVYERLLDVAPLYADALFGRSVVLYETKGENLQSLKAANEGFETFLKTYPESPRAALARKLVRMTGEAVAAGGLQKWQASRVEERRLRVANLDLSPQKMKAPHPPMGTGGEAAPPVVSEQAMQAMQEMERTPELEAQLTRTVEQGEEHLARGRYEEALAAYRQVMPLRPDARVQAGLAWTLIGLGKPTAERVWSVAVSTDPSVVDQLGDTLQAKGDAKGAKALWTRLADSAPDYAARASLRAKLSR
jgi:tetratricopeptide (TPR) repeat protein